MNFSSTIMQSPFKLRDLSTFKFCKFGQFCDSIIVNENFSGFFQEQYEKVLVIVKF